MPTHRIGKQTEKRLWDWLENYKLKEEITKKYTFDEALSELLREVEIEHILGPGDF